MVAPAIAYGRNAGIPDSEGCFRRRIPPIAGRRRNLAVLALVLLLLPGCDSGPPRGAETTPAQDSAAAEELERASRRAYSEAVNAADSLAHMEVSEGDRYGGTIVVAGRNDIVTLNPSDTGTNPLCLAAMAMVSKSRPANANSLPAASLLSIPPISGTGFGSRGSAILYLIPG